MSPLPLFHNICLGGFTLLLSTLALEGCGGTANIIKDLALVPVLDPSSLVLDVPIGFILSGTGKCSSINIDWGDGDRDAAHVFNTGGPYWPIDLSGNSNDAIRSRTLTHTFTGWGGGKTVTVEANSGCEGKVNLRFKIPPLEYTTGLNQPGKNICETPTPPLPDLIPRMLVHIRTVNVGPGINFGCFANGCIYDGDGRAGSVAAPPYPFPGMREASLVLRVGTQVVQGGTNVQFTTTDRGPLEFCLNDFDVTNNLGGWGIYTSVDQLGQ